MHRKPKTINRVYAHNLYAEVVVMVRDEVRDRVSLYISREVRREARKQNINLSEASEDWLRAITIVGKNDVNVYGAYGKLFETIVPLLDKYNCMVRVAEGQELVPMPDKDGNEYETPHSLNIFLTRDGSFYIDEHDKYFEDMRIIAPDDFLEPDEILKNLVNVLSKNQKILKEKMRELLMAKNIVYAISNNLLDDKSAEKDEPSSGSKKTKKYRKASKK